MNKKVSLAILSGLLLALVGITQSMLPTAQAQENINFVPNASFEVEGSGGVGDALVWREGTHHQRASDKFVTGNWALKSSFTGAGGTATRVTIAVLPNMSYVLSGYIWNDATNKGHRSCLDMNDIQGELQLCTPSIGQWQFVSGSWASGSTTSLILRLLVDGSPNAGSWFDDISLAPQMSMPMPTATFNPTATSTPKPTYTSILIPTDTPPPTDIPTSTEIPTLLPTDTPIPTEAYMPLPAQTLAPTETDVPLPTDTSIPAETQTPLPTDTPPPTETASATLSASDTPTPTDMPTSTKTRTPLPTSTEAYTSTPLNTPTPIQTYTSPPLATPLPTLMPIPTTAQANAVTVVGAGDISCGADSALSTAGCEQGATQNLLLALNPDRILALGDNQYENGALSDYNTYFNATWGLFKNKISPIVGNHEYQTSGAAGYFDYFNGPGKATGPAGDRTKGYYSYNLGNWHLIAVNSNCDKVGGCGPGSPEYTWLQNDLATDTHTCTLMYMHHPFTASDRRNYDIASPYEPFYELFYAAGGEVVLSGHSHFYERFARLNSQKQPDLDYGFRQFVAGTGGRSTQWFIEIRPYSEVHAGRLFGLIKLSLRQNDYSWEFVPTPGYTFTDSGTETCHGPHP